jgi:hypothetical protein
MASSMVILGNARGPLPLSKQFQAPSDAPVDLFISGSVRTKSAPTLVGVNIELDGKVIGQSQVWCNENDSHRALVPVIIPLQFGFGAHTVTVTPQNAAAITDVNDYFNVVLMF